MAGLAYEISAKLELKWKIDDPLDVAPIHLCAGLWGVIATGIFNTE